MKIDIDWDAFWRVANDPTAQAALTAVNPAAGLALGTIAHLDTVVEKAKKGNPAALAMVKDIKSRATLGDPQAQNAVVAMTVVSKKQEQKKGESLYAKGMMSVGHDPISFGATRDQRGGSGGGGVTVTPGLIANAIKAQRKKGALVDWRGGKPKQVTNYGEHALQGSPWAGFGQTTGPQAIVFNPEAPPMQVTDGVPIPRPLAGQGQYPPGYDPSQFPPGYDPSQFPPGYDPYGGFGAMPPGYDPYGGFGLPGLPPGYGYEEPLIDRGGFQQYDPDTDSFYSSNQKQVYDDATGMFYPAPAESYNPFGF